MIRFCRFAGSRKWFIDSCWLIDEVTAWLIDVLIYTINRCINDIDSSVNEFNLQIETNHCSFDDFSQFVALVVRMTARSNETNQR